MRTTLRLALAGSVAFAGSPVNARELAYVANNGAGTLSVVDTAINGLTATVSFGNSADPAGLRSGTARVRVVPA